MGLDLDPCWADDGPFKLGPRRLKLSDQLDLLPAPADDEDDGASCDPPPTPAQRRRMLRAAAMHLARRAGFTIDQCAAAFGLSRSAAWKVLRDKGKTIPSLGSRRDARQHDPGLARRRDPP